MTPLTLKQRTQRDVQTGDSIHRLSTLLAAIAWLILPGNLQAQLFENLRSLAPRYPVGDPSITNATRGPKGIVAGDFNGDGRADFAVSDKNGSVTLYFSLGGGGFEPPFYLQTGNHELRGIVAADFNKDGRLDIATASPFSGTIHVLLNRATKVFEDSPVAAWQGVRDLLAADFDGDGTSDLVAAGPGAGLRQYKGLGDGRFGSLVSFQQLDGAGCTTDSDNFPQPAFFLHGFRAPGANKDSLVAAQGDGCSTLWVFRPDSQGILSITSTLTNLDVNAIAVGAVRMPKASGALDLVTSSLDGGYVEVREFDTSIGTFKSEATQRIQIAGGPRSLKLTDWDQDGWNDLAVVQRFTDTVTLYNNTNGTFAPGPKLSVGRLPRELETADFTADGQQDLVVVNRYSLDVTLVPGFAGKASFSALDQVYPVEGTVTGLDVRDFNKDGLGDVAQLHVASAEFSIRLAQPGGLLGEPTFYPVGVRPSAQVVTDVNNDGVWDMVAVDLNGSVSVRLGRADGSFGEEQKLLLPASAQGALFALIAADFNNDGKLDLAAGYLDCRILFLQGNGDGTFRLGAPHVQPMFFTYEARVMAIGDFDKDGDLDFAGAGLDGVLVIAENKGDFLTTTALHLTRYEQHRIPSLRAIHVLDENRDGDLDILVAGFGGAELYLGQEGLGFKPASDGLFDTKVTGTAAALGDFDGDGKEDLAVADADSNTLSISIRKSPGDPWELALIVSVPSGSLLASGDLDGDGKADLVGSGSVLWTALSSRRARAVARQAEVLREGSSQGVVLNEFLASNASLPVAADNGRLTDWVEIYNASNDSLSLSNWTLLLIEPGSRPGRFKTNTFAFPADNTLPSKSRQIIVAADKKRTPLHTGFPLPAEGATLELKNAAGELQDRLVYQTQETDRSFSRFRDGYNGWVVNPYPTPGSPNVDNGTLDPRLSFQGIDGDTLKPGVPLRFRATGRDDLAITTVAVFWRRLDIGETTYKRTLLYDDGLHDDGASQDGSFSGVLPRGLPAGARIQFYLAATDLTDKTIYVPSRPERALAGLDSDLFAAIVGGARPTLEISEVVALNATGLKDETGGFPDWVEIHNYGEAPVRFEGITLGRSLLGNSGRFVFPNGFQLAAGAYLVVFCDAQGDSAPWHAPFALSSSRDALFLTGTSSEGIRTLIDEVEFGPLNTDLAYARRGVRGPWTVQAPTPYRANQSGIRITVADGVGFLSFGTGSGEPFTLEYKNSLNDPSWSSWATGLGDGTDKVYRLPGEGARYFRVRPN